MIGGLWTHKAALALLTVCILAPAYAQSGLDQRATVFITTACENPQTGATPEEQGTGFIIERSGYVLTAYHVVSCWDPESRSLWPRKKIAGRIGSPWDPLDWKLQLYSFSEQSDIAILKFLGMPRHHPTLTICVLRNPPTEMAFVAAGFPEGRPYQPVDGRIGTTEAGGGLWAAAAPFVSGMSGGPVAHNGFVVGMVKGGYVKGKLAYVTALSAVTPIHRAAPLIETEIGLRLSECSSLPPFMPGTVAPAAPPDAIETVRSFYTALGRADGVHASSFVVPEKRASGPFSATEIIKFYGSLPEPLRLTNVFSLGGDRFQVNYTFRRPSGSWCYGSAEVTTTQRDGRPLIQGIKANC